MNRDEAREHIVTHLALEMMGLRVSVNEVLGKAYDAGYQAGSEGRWVPIRSVDDLPKESGYYSVTLTPSDFHEEVEVAYFHFSSKSWSRVFGSPLHTYLNVGSVIAWMPLPPAYKED